MSRSRPDPAPGPVLSHLLVAGGAVEGWCEFGEERWRERIVACGEVAASFGVPWLTLRPLEGHADTEALSRLLGDLCRATGGERGPGGVTCEPVPGVVTLVAPQADGRQRIADAISQLAAAGTRPDELDEELMVRTLLAPSGDEPDLVVVLGPPDRLPPSLVWELAYAELVFLDVAWERFDPTDLDLAVDDFRRRDRRFGGIDA